MTKLLSRCAFRVRAVSQQHSDNSQVADRGECLRRDVHDVRSKARPLSRDLPSIDNDAQSPCPANTQTTTHVWLPGAMALCKVQPALHVSTRAQPPNSIGVHDSAELIDTQGDRTQRSSESEKCA